MASVVSAITNTIPITQFNRGLAGKIFEEVKRSGAKVVMKNNTAECVLLSPEEYVRLMDEVNDARLLTIATEDKLHQQYRMPLMPGSREVFDMARLCGAKAVYVSGAGSTVMAVAEKAEAEKFYSKLEKGLELLEGLDGCEAFTLLQLDADNTGATVE